MSGRDITSEILLNREIIATDQDSLGRPATLVLSRETGRCGERVLTAVVQQHRKAREAVSLLSAEAFTDPERQKIFGAIRRLHCRTADGGGGSRGGGSGTGARLMLVTSQLISHHQMRTQQDKGSVRPLCRNIPEICRWHGVWWILSDDRWLRITDSHLASRLDRIAMWLDAAEEARGLLRVRRAEDRGVACVVTTRSRPVDGS